MKDEINIESCTPTLELKDSIREFVLLSINSHQKQTITSIDDGCYDFVFQKEKRFTLHFEKDKTASISSNVFTINQLDPPCKYLFGKTASFFSVKVQPWANSLFFPNHLNYGFVQLDQVYGKEIVELHVNIFRSSSFKEKVKFTEDFFRRLNLNLSVDAKFIKMICEYIYENKGMVTVNHLSEKYMVDRQNLNKQFFECVKYTLKRFIIIVRIMSAIKFKINNTNRSLTEVAHKFGYFDQSHFNYDFKRIGGVTPAAFFKELSPFFIRHKK